VNPVTYEYYYDSIFNPGLLSKIAKYTIGLPIIIIDQIKGSSSSDYNQNQVELVNISQSEFEHFKRLSKIRFQSNIIRKRVLFH
jgi:hypothetical protein